MNSEFDNLAPPHIAYGTLDGLYCLGCEAPIVGEGFPCYCNEELEMDAHVSIRWCSLECLYRTHMVPEYIGSEGVSWSNV